MQKLGLSINQSIISLNFCVFLTDGANVTTSPAGEAGRLRWRKEQTHWKNEQPERCVCGWGKGRGVGVGGCGMKTLCVVMSPVHEHRLPAYYVSR